jgi:hypothetical protein
LRSSSPEKGEAKDVSARAPEYPFLTVVALAAVAASPLVGALSAFKLKVDRVSAARARADRLGRCLLLGE